MAIKSFQQAEGEFKNALAAFDASSKIEFPNTGYYLPVIYSLTGMKVETLEDLKKPLEFARGLLPPHVKGKNHLPYLGPLLDAGMAAIFGYEIIEALRILREPDFYIPQEDPDLEAGKMWVGPADDIILRKRGVEFVDGSAPGFAAIVGACPDPETAKMIVEDYQKKNLYIFCAANHNGTSVIQQLIEAGVQIGWNTRIVPFGPDISSAVFALGFANRAAMAFGGVQPGDYKKILLYNKERVFAFVNAFGDIGTEWGVAAAGCVNWGFPTLADTDIPEILPTGICTYEHVVANVPHDEICQKSVEVRGLKVTVSEIDIPCSFGPAFEGRTCSWRRSVLPDGRRQNPGHRAGQDGRYEGNRRCQGRCGSDPMSAISRKAKPCRWGFSCRWPAVRCRPTSNRSWNARSTT